MNPQQIEKYKELYLQTAQQYLQTFSVNLNGYLTKNFEHNFLEQMFIAIHSIKSQSLVMGYTNLGNYCKDIEELLRTAKDSGQPMRAEQLQTLQEAQKKISEEIALIDRTGTDIQSQKATTNPESLEPEHPNGKKLLLIEDDPFFERFYSYKLKESGFRVEIAKNGQEGLQALTSFLPDIILLDLIMPIKDGFQVLTEKAQITDNNIRSIPTIVFSTLGQESDIKRAISLGAVDYVNKSFFDYEKLLAKINEHLKS